MRVLLAEDDELLGSGLKLGLQQQGWQVDWVRDGMAAEREMLLAQHQAVVLDLGLPRQDGIQTLQTVRSRGITTPVLVLTARDAVGDRITGLDNWGNHILHLHLIVVGTNCIHHRRVFTIFLRQFSS